MIMRVFRLLLRACAGVCVAPGLRVALLRLSGIGIGSRTFVNLGVRFVDNYRGGAIRLGERVAIAPGAMFVADSDPNESRLGTIEPFHIRGQVTIEDDAWIGAGAIVLPNVTVGRCAVVGAGAIVTKNVEEYAIVVGNPARPIGDVREKPGWKG